MNKLHTNGLVILIALICFSANAQMMELNDWAFSQAIELDNEIIQDPRLQAVFIEDMLLVTHPSLDAGTGCGEALLLAVGEDGNFVQIQKLSAEDFGGGCDEQDGFGFSVDYADGLLVIGAPGQVFVDLEEQPSPGSIYIYRLSEVGQNSLDKRVIGQAHVSGPAEADNLAWGTRVKTDGRRILVQGNQGRDANISQPRVIARMVNLLENNTGNNWSISRQFSDNTTIYGSDFLIDDRSIIISKHDFERSFGGGINNPAVNAYNSSLEVYAYSQMTIDAELSQSIGFTTEVVIIDRESNDRLQSIDQLFHRQNKLVVRVPLWAPFSGKTEFIWYEPNQNNLYQATNVLDFHGQDININDRLSTVGGVAVFENVFRNRGTITEYSSNLEGVEKLSQQTITDRGNRTVSSIGLDFFRLNADNNRLLLARNQQGLRQLSVFSARPALDPAITGIWWFGQQFNGQGITLEVLTGNRLLIHWFSYDLSGKQMWMRGVGELEDGSVKMQLVRARGPRFPINQFNPNDKTSETWGSIEIVFNDCRTGQLDYQSQEFGNASLPLMSLVNNDALCNRGFIIDSEDNEIASKFKYGPFSIVGSSYDKRRGGEGFIFMPAQVINNDSASRNIVGLWLTYNQQGDQAWYYLGQLEGRGCGFTSCVWETVGQPRMSEGPVFGPGYDSNDRVITPWGELGPLVQGNIFNGLRSTQFSVDFVNPDGFGDLVLDKLTHPIGY